MDIQFPSDPTVGQEFAGWRWDGEKWTCIPAEAAWWGIPEAPIPSNGNLYGRKDGEWFIIPPPEDTGVITGVSAFHGRTGAVTLQWADVSSAGGAPINSPAFTGTPTAPTLSSLTNNTQAATAAYFNNWYMPYTGGTMQPGALRIQNSAGTYYIQTQTSGDIGYYANTQYRTSPPGVAAGFNCQRNGVRRWSMCWGGFTHFDWNGNPTGGVGAGGISVSPLMINFNDGNVECCTGMPGAQTYVNRPGVINQYVNVYGTLYFGAASPISDERIKENIAPSEVNALGVVNRIPLVQYDLKQGICDFYLLKRNPTKRHKDIGIITQQVQELFPGCVMATQGSEAPFPRDCQSLNMTALVPLLIKAVQQLGARVGALEARRG